MMSACPGTTVPASLFALHHDAPGCTCHPLSAWFPTNHTAGDCGPKLEGKLIIEYTIVVIIYVLQVLMIPRGTHKTRIPLMLVYISICLAFCRAIQVFSLMVFDPLGVAWGDALNFWLLTSLGAWMNELSQRAVEYQIKMKYYTVRELETLYDIPLTLALVSCMWYTRRVDKQAIDILVSIMIFAIHSLFRAFMDGLSLRHLRNKLTQKERRLLRHKAWYNFGQFLYRLLVVYVLCDIPRFRFLVNVVYIVEIVPSAHYSTFMVDYFREEEEEGEVEPKGEGLHERLLPEEV